MSRRRMPIGGYGEISYQRRNDVVRAVTRVRDTDGVLRRVSASGSSKDKARRTLLVDIEERFRSSGSASHAGITPDTKIRVLAEEWIQECQLRDLSTSTMRIYQSSVDLYINPYMGEWLIREATTRAVDRVIKDHIASGLDSKALRKHLNQIFALAVRHDALPANPITNVAKVRRRPRDVRSLETATQVADIRALIERSEQTDRPGPRANRDLRDVVLLLVSTGARIGEILALRWSDVNLLADRPYLLITGTIKQERGLGIYRQPQPKTTTSIRPLELPPSVVAMLLARRVAQGDNPIDAVFPSRVGTWQPYSSMRRRWIVVTKGTPYEWVTFKTFRKQVATLLARELGASVAKEQLGHASESTTETFYITQNTTAPRVAGLVEKFIQDSSPPHGPT